VDFLTTKFTKGLGVDWRPQPSFSTTEYTENTEILKVVALKHEPYPEKPHVRPINLVW